jgi:type III pantothenate kinase
VRLLGRAPRLLISGGGGERLGQALEIESELVPCLVLEGLAVYASQTGADAP